MRDAFCLSLRREGGGKNVGAVDVKQTVVFAEECGKRQPQTVEKIHDILLE
jgi:hypothetical protein